MNDTATVCGVAASYVCYRYTGAACEFCLASFYPTAARSCIPQYISGKNIFDPIETEPPLSGWALALVILAGLVALTILVGMGVTLWTWLLHGVQPKTQLETARKRLRAWWEARMLVRARAVLRRFRAAKHAAAGKKYEVGDQVELAGGLKSKKPFHSEGGNVEVRAEIGNMLVLHHGASTQQQLGWVAL